MSKSKKSKSMFQIQVDTGNLPVKKRDKYLANLSKQLKKAFKKYGGIIVTDASINVIRVM